MMREDRSRTGEAGRRSPEDRAGGLSARLERARQYFREHHAGVEPDAGFAGRVAARLDGQVTEILGWAAWKLLPATLAIALVLAFFVLRVTPGTDLTTSVSPTEDPVAWILNDTEVTR
jgi:hypothetical protein